MRVLREYLHLIGVGCTSIWQLVRGYHVISKMRNPIVTVFGSGLIDTHDALCSKAAELGILLVKHGMSVLTGGGPGLMESVSCSIEKESKTKRKNAVLGIAIPGINEDVISRCAPVLLVKYFFIRKWLLSRYSSAFIVFPGGFGTLDETAEVIDLIKTNKIHRVPVILYDSSYWAPFLQWVKTGLKKGLIKQEHYDLLTLQDDINEIVKIIVKKER